MRNKWCKQCFKNYDNGNRRRSGNKRSNSFPTVWGRNNNWKSFKVQIKKQHDDRNEKLSLYVSQVSILLFIYFFQNIFRNSIISCIARPLQPLWKWHIKEPRLRIIIFVSHGVLRPIYIRWANAHSIKFF